MVCSIKKSIILIICKHNRHHNDERKPLRKYKELNDVLRNKSLNDANRMLDRHHSFTNNKTLSIVFQIS